MKRMKKKIIIKYREGNMDFRNNITIEKARETFDKKSLDH